MDDGQGRSAPVLSAQGLSVSFPTAAGRLYAVRQVDFEIRRGESLGIVGESGSGKSVTASALLGLLGKDAVVGGRVRLEDVEVFDLPPDRLRGIRGTRMSMIFQEPSRSFDPISSIGKAFEETLRVADPSLSREACRDRACRLLTEVHIPRAEERLRNFPHQFSGGMLQRIMIALALADNPQVLIADEPTTALDVTIQSQIIALLKELQTERGLALLFISHNLALVGQIADRILVMYGGLVLEEGSVEEVLNHPRSPYTRALLDALPGWGSHYSRGRLSTIPGSVPDPTAPEPGCPFAPRCPLVTEQCRTSVPVLVREQGGRQVEVGPEERSAGSVYRCIVAGVK
ncbi:MAG TPA: ABC transporter ATP-binding protein [Spirochaetia bacterium]|nr:ABC transporter ATP-binding protein [Spirochaetia bacterium]